MAKNIEQSESRKKIHGKAIRTTDDLELLKIILEENPRLKMKVLHVLSVALGKVPPSSAAFEDDLTKKANRFKS